MEDLKAIFRQRITLPLKAWANRKLQNLDEWARQETARALSDENEVPEVTGKRILSVVVRSIPFMRPMFVHIITIFLVGFALTFLFTFTGTVSSDMWDNKMLVNDKLQPLQSVLILVDETYVKGEYLTEEENAENERLGYSSDELTQAQRKTVRNRMLVWFFIGALFGIVLQAFYRYYPAWVWQNVNHFLRVAMVERLEYLSLSFHHTNRAGDAIYRIYQDSSMVVNVLQEVIIGPIEDLRGLFIGFIFLLAFDPILLGVVFLAFIPMAYLTAVGTPIIRRLAVANRVLNSNLTSRLQETFAAIKIFKANGTEAIADERFERDSAKALNAALYVRFGMVFLSMLVALIGGLTIIGLEFLLVNWVLEERATNMPTWLLAVIGFQVWNLAAFSSANDRIGQTTGGARGFVRLWCMWQDLFIGLERAFYFLDLEATVVDRPDPEEFPTPVTSVEWRNVEYGYEGGETVLKGMDLEASVGTVTAIVGNTGAGKSTVVNLLLRLYDPIEGQVRINGRDLRDLRIDDIRQNVAIAMQKNVLFTGTVYDNISFGTPDAQPEDVAEAARIACAEEFILEMSDAYSTELGDRGSKLSAGQRQRLTIARALVRDTPILILDEPTASLDAKNEQRVLANLAEWGREKIVFLITHRLSTIRNADNIAFLEDGRIVEFGSHDELMSRPQGRYRTFVEAEEIGMATTS